MVDPINKSIAGANKARIFLGLSVLATFLAYRGLLDNQFIEWDDSVLILGNYSIHQIDFASLKWMFTQSFSGNYIPLTWLSLALDFQIGRLEPWIYHLGNLLFHALNVALVFSLSRKLLAFIQDLNLKKDSGERLKGVESANWPLWSAFGTALLFGLHPLHVESVAWASERKDVLCAFFYIASLWVYLDYTKQIRSHFINQKPSPLGGEGRVRGVDNPEIATLTPSLSPQGRGRKGLSSVYEMIPKFWASLGLFTAAVLSKPMAVSLPLVFLLLDVWPLARFQKTPQRILVEKIPFLVVALGAGVIAMLSQHQAGAAAGFQEYPFLSRLMNAGHSTVFYLEKMLFPVKLAAYYPLRPDRVFTFPYLLSALVVLALSVLCFFQRKKRPFLAATWIFYLVVLAPALGILQVGTQGAADRYTYLPSWGPFLLLSAVLAKTLLRKPRLLLALVFLSAALLSHGTYRQVFHWKDTLALWENIFRCGPENNYIAYYNLGSAYEKAGQWEEALFNYSMSIKINPYFLGSYWGKAKVSMAEGYLDDSIAEFKVALQMNPNLPHLHSDLSAAYLKKGMRAEALAEAQKAVQLDPNFVGAQYQLGAAYLAQARAREAVAAFAKARSMDPDNPLYTRDLIKALKRSGDDRAALDLYREIARHPRSVLSMNF